MARGGGSRRVGLEFLGRASLVSLRLDGMRITETEVIEALFKSGVRGDLRSRQAQMIRNHAAALMHIELCLRRQVPLRPAMVLGWYASLCGGLPATGLDGLGMQRLELVCRQINSPPLRLQAAIGDIALLHFRLLSDPVVPSFNGILARLLLRYHLGRCRLPQIVFEEELDQPGTYDESQLYARLLTLLDTRLLQLEKERLH
jgi:hypothetical protein